MNLFFKLSFRLNSFLNFHILLRFQAFVRVEAWFCSVNSLKKLTKRHNLTLVFIWRVLATVTEVRAEWARTCPQELELACNFKRLSPSSPLQAHIQRVIRVSAVPYPSHQDLNLQSSRCFIHWHSRATFLQPVRLWIKKWKLVNSTFALSNEN